MALSAIGGGGMPVAPQGGMINQGGVTPRPVNNFRPNSNMYDQFSSSGTPAAGGKGGGATTPAAPIPTQGQPVPVAPQGGFNVNQAAAGALQQAMQGTQEGLGFEAGRTRVFGYNPAKYRAYTLAKTNLDRYQNPFTQQVIDRTRQDIERQQAGSLNTLGSQAETAGAFGGGRHGLAEGAMMGEYGRTFGDIAAQQRQAGYNQALQAAQFDIGQRTGAQAANAAAQTAARQYRAGARTAAQQQRFTNQLAAERQRMGAASQLAGLGRQAFNTGQTIQQQQAQQGLLQQGMQQALIDAARGQYAGYVGAPAAALQAPLAALGAAPSPGSTTTSSTQPGLYSYLQTAAMLPGNPFGFSDARLKTNVTPKGEKSGVKFYTWDWNEAGKKVADPAQPTFGVIADELQKTHPHLVLRGDDGYLRVNYAGLANELENAAMLPGNPFGFNI